MAYETILQTKLYRPRTPQYFIPRPHLVAKLNDNLCAQASVFRYRFSLISAPAGYGKSILLSEWSNQSQIPTIWLSLDASDSDVQRFWSHFIAALRAIFPLINVSSFVSLHTEKNSDVQQVLDEWINQITQRSEPFVFILDDYHLISDPSVHQSLAYWIDHSPPQMQLVIATRSDPPLPLSRLRGRGQLFELRTDNLRFSIEEIATFLNRAMHLDLSPESIVALETRTEGWIAGIQMVALSLQRRSPQEIARFIDNFTGSHRYILDYLTDEVLLQQSERIQTFLLHTCILDRFTSSLCAAVTGQTDSQRLLDQLESANLFVIPLDEERRWYRYHHLFANMLFQRLERLQPDMVPELNRLASQWCEQNDFVIDALRYALISGDAIRVARLVAHNVLAMMEFGELKTLERWLNTLPEEAVRTSPWLNLARAWLLTSIGQLDNAEHLLTRAQAALVSSADPSSEHNQGIKGNLLAVRAYISGLRGDYCRTIQYARECLEYVPQADYWMRSWGNVTLAYALAHCGQPEGAEKKLAEALQISRETGASHVHILALNNYASIKLSKGYLSQAAEIFQQAIQHDQSYSNRTGQHMPIAGYAYTHLAKITCEWNDLEAADAYIKDGLRICEDWGEPQLLSSGYLCLAEIRAEHSDWAGAHEAIAKAKQAVGNLAIDYSKYIAPLQALIHLLSGDMAAARYWSACEADISNTQSDSSENRFSSYVFSRILFAHGELEAAFDRLFHLFKEAQSTGDKLSMIRALILQTLILDKQRKPKQALDTLTQALSLAEPDGYVRSFLTYGATLEHLLMKAARRGISAQYAHRLLETFQSAPQLYGIKSMKVGLSLDEPLSERELQVLRLIANHLTRPQIAQQLIVSENTVRTHLKNIYLKLDAHSRAEAICRAREFGILE
jgi:LuxR family maltose regulon positive regulatory protein